MFKNSALIFLGILGTIIVCRSCGMMDKNNANAAAPDPAPAPSMTQTYTAPQETTREVVYVDRNAEVNTAANVINAAANVTNAVFNGIFTFSNHGHRHHGRGGVIIYGGGRNGCYGPGYVESYNRPSAGTMLGNTLRSANRNKARENRRGY